MADLTDLLPSDQLDDHITPPGTLRIRSVDDKVNALSTFDTAEWRRKLEDEEIERYLMDFGKVSGLSDHQHRFDVNG